MDAIALGVDTSQAFLTPSRRRGLIEGVRDAPAQESEPDWLEWKSSVDLTQKRWLAEIARHVIGFANRSPDKAARAAGGFAYLLLGVEPRNLCGVARVDNASLEAGVTTYTGRDGPQWSPEYIDIGGLEVLIVTIAPPRDGDRIYAFEKEFQYADPATGIRSHYRNGDIFVRREGRTERANAAEIRVLERRHAAATPAQRTLDVEVTFWGDEPKVVTPVDLGESSVTGWIERERRRLARPPDPGEIGTKERPTVAAEIKRMENVFGAGFLRKFEQQLIPEERDPAEYDKSVERYLSSSREHVGLLAAYHALQARIGAIRLAIANGTADNYAGVVADVHLPGNVRAFLSRFELERELDATSIAAEPRKWGPRTKKPAGLFPDYSRLTNLTRSLSTPGLAPIAPRPRPRIDNSGSARIVFPPVDIRPEHVHALDEVYLVVVGSETSEIVAEWSATATSVSGVARGELRVSLGQPVSVSELFELPFRDDDD